MIVADHEGFIILHLFHDIGLKLLKELLIIVEVARTVCNEVLCEIPIIKGNVYRWDIKLGILTSSNKTVDDSPHSLRSVVVQSGECTMLDVLSGLNTKQQIQELWTSSTTT